MMVQYQELLMSMFSNADSRRDEAWVARLHHLLVLLVISSFTDKVAEDISTKLGR